MGKKYIIELEDEVDGLCKAKGFNTLVFDKNGISKLTPYEEKKEESKGRWHPHCGDMYWHIVRSETGCYEWDGGSVDNAMWRVGNCFRTKEEAEFALEQLKVIAQLKEYAEPEDVQWDLEKIHHTIIYENKSQKIEVGISCFYKHSELTFASKEDALAAVEAVGEERVKKYYLGVK